MSENENWPLKIFNAFEDLYFEKDKGKIFDAVFTKYFTLVDVHIEQHMDLYDVLVLIRSRHPEQFDEMVRELREHSLISD